MGNPKFLDEYTIYARFFPSIISALPLLVLWYFLSGNTQIKDLLNFLVSIKLFGTISITVIFLYFYSQFIRVISKYFESRYFVRDKGFPTTYLMK